MSFIFKYSFFFARVGNRFALEAIMSFRLHHQNWFLQNLSTFLISLVSLWKSWSSKQALHALFVNPNNNCVMCFRQKIPILRSFFLLRPSNFTQNSLYMWWSRLIVSGFKTSFFSLYGWWLLCFTAAVGFSSESTTLHLISHARTNVLVWWSVTIYFQNKLQ